MGVNPGQLSYWRLVSVRISSNAPQPELYCLLYEGEIDRPLTRHGKILFFNDPKRANEMLDQYGYRELADDVDLDAPMYCFDLANLFYVLTSEKVDEEGTVIDTINLMLDFIKVCPFTPPAGYLTALGRLADHFTFSRDIRPFLGDTANSENTVSDAILWCIGNIVSIAEVTRV